ncbi:GIY-YIG nuclease family protein [Alkalicoccobacillus gibsonii]|uniref:GIY-YIG nuclease family protein n=1 Tax=Alkalicoccobacillus gibsonii TaxID=79881 RepID=UPI0019342A0B|nr:GIY-YIG nuclease family protein [Alkalicoccobacillus gibsonii]MBM0064037.1 GIY-YIG nuclease family protein [Alkalicoccobacillus gibsonii]
MNLSQTTNQQEPLELRSDFFYVYEYYITDSGDVFYVGKGATKRAWKDTRNAACEQIKKDYKWDVRIVQENLTEEAALAMEKGLILKYREEGDLLTNILPGGIKATDTEIVANLKYLLFLLEKKVINVSLSELANFFLMSSSTVWHIANEGHYREVEPTIPESINEIIKQFHSNAYNEDRTRAGNAKYVLSLLEKGVIRCSQAKIAEHYGMTPSNISSIKKGQTYNDVPPLIPDDIGIILEKFNPFYLSEEEKLKGRIAFIVRLRNEGIISITNTDIATLLSTTSYLVAEFTRTNEDRKYIYKEVRPTNEIMQKLIPYFVLKS